MMNRHVVGYILLVLVVATSIAYNVTRPRVEYVMTPNEAVENEITRTILTTCRHNGYLTINEYAFLCVRLGE